MLSQIAFSLALSAAFFIFVWGFLQISKNPTQSHGFWFLSFLIPFALDFYLDGTKHANVIMFIMVLIWSLRQSAFHFWRLRRLPLDPRYKDMTRNWKPMFFKTNSFIYLILPQWIFHALLCSGFYIYLSSPDSGWSAPFWNVPLAWVYLFGLTLQTVADIQLYRFKRDPQNQDLTYTGGVWRFIRYPNYFGEFLIWLSFGLLALPFKYGYLGLLTPVVCFLLLTRWTGIALLEKRRGAQKSAPNKRPKYNWIPWIY